jgi:CheY-like chemotaxis protein
MNDSAFFLNSCGAAPAEDLYELTARGQEELRNGSTRASTLALELLVCFDGANTAAQLQARLEHVAPQSFDETFKLLLDAGLVHRVLADPFEQMLQAQLEQLHTGSADAGAAALRRQGYYVEIARARPPRPRAAQGPLHAVVIEDEPVLARFVKTYLQLEGIETRLAHDRAQVSATLSSLPVPDVILLDVQLPDADGFDILARLRAHEVFRQVPVIMLTGQATREAVIRGIAGGADGYVTKPFEAESLVRAVRTCLGLSHPEPAVPHPWTNADAKALKWQHKPAR